MTTPKPSPRIVDGVPFCEESACMCEVQNDGGFYVCSITGRQTDCVYACEPVVREISAALVQLRLRSRVAMVNEHGCAVCGRLFDGYMGERYDHAPDCPMVKP